MKKWLLHIMFVSVLGMLAASCRQEADEPTQTADSRTAQVVFTIALDSPSAGSRGLWGDNYDGNSTNDYESAIGTEFDNYINPSQFFVNLTLGSITYDVQNIAYWQTSTKNVYEFVGDVNVPIDGNQTFEDAKIQVYANMDPDNSTFTTNYTKNPGTGVAYIPMWGVQTVNLSLTPGTRTELADPIYLLRAMAKIEVIMAAEDCEIEDIKLNGYNTTGYCLPEGATGATGATNTKNLDLEGVFRPMPSYRETNDSFAESTNVEGNQCYTIYVPEYRNISNTQTTATHATITVTVDGKDYDIEFKQYANGSPIGEAYNIVRNHWYQYTITAVKTGFDLKLTVAPWTDVQQSFNYEDELSYDDGSWINATVTTDEQEREIVSLKTAATADATDVTAVYNFNINTPQTIEWMAVLEDPEGKFQFDMSQTSGKGTVEGDNSIQRTVRGELLVTGSNLNLGVKAIDPSESGQYEAILRVYVMYGGKTFELDLTDGEEAALNHFTIQHSKL